MARYEHIKIFQSAYILTLDIYRTTRSFSREYKYTLGEKLKNTAHDLLDLIMKINTLPDNKKSRYFPSIDFKKENLRVYLRIAFDLKLLSGGKLAAFSSQLEELGKQLGGWQRWAAKR